ncbi:zinc finger CCCH-type with G patch domain-containing protein isoform X2 [Bombyx mori]|uniref:Zinc finger CCCH-type with G patch domain-containing protein n=3 Tax=Bombyx mori TaxID=7091 RepID=A0A8R2ARU9_BOMMO|nr:zinc finger CCCH-type with G patch domain-containing protein isoform X1 [Bombyx mori]
MEDLESSLNQYKEQIKIVQQSLEATHDLKEKESLLTLQSDLNQLIELTRESLATATSKHLKSDLQNNEQNNLDEEYARFMAEMNDSNAYNDDSKNKNDSEENNGNSDIEDDLSSLLGMRCAVYHTHKWGGQPSLHNAMVSSILPRADDDQFNDLKVQILFTHPTHAEMLPCPFYLDGDCKFSDEQCRYSHGNVVQLSDLKEAIEPNFSSLKSGSSILLKLKPPDDENVSITKKSTEKYHLWHRGIVKSIDNENQLCTVKLEHGVKTGEKRKMGSDEINVRIEDIFPLTTVCEDDSDSSEDLSDSEYSHQKTTRTEIDRHALIVEKSLQNNAPAMGEWERHTRGIGSKIMFAMGYVAGSGLGAAGEGRTQPVEARVLPVGKSLDHCMAISEKHAGQDPLKVQQKLKRLQKKEEERNKRAYEREKEKERRNVFNFINRTLGDKEQTETNNCDPTEVDVKQSTSKDLNIEKFKIDEDVNRIEREIIKLNNSLVKYPQGTSGHTNINLQIREKTKELQALKQRERDIIKEQRHRKEKEKMTIF